MADHPSHFELGVLFVHGIGEQAEGETLIHCGGALTKWLNAWRLARRPEEPKVIQSGSEKRREAKPVPRDSVEHLHAFLKSDAREPGVPPHAVVKLITEPHEPAEPGNQSDGTCWLLTESHWANVIRPPTFFRLFQWALLIYPWIASAHFGVLLMRRWTNFLRAPRGTALGQILARAKVALLFIPAMVLTVLYMVISVILTVIVMALLALVVVLALPPLPWLRRILLKVQKTLSGTVGDSMILCADPLQAAAIITRVRDDLRWMMDQTSRVVIVAHSQGAAVADLALRQGGAQHLADKNGLLITYGSGLGKLTEIAHALRERDSWRQKVGWIPIGGMFAMVLGICGRANAIDILSANWDWILIAGGAFFWWMGSIVGLSGHQFPKSLFEPRKAYGVELEWWDYYASADPVPNGPLMEAPPDGLRSIEVHNRGNKVSDHSTYWENPDGFVARIAHRLAKFSGLNVFNQDDELHLQAAWARRRWRVGWLRVAGVMAILAAGLLPHAMKSDLPVLGRNVAASISLFEKPLPSFVRDFANDVVPNNWAAANYLGLSVLLVLAGAGFLVAHGAWRLWDHFDAKKLTEKKPYSLDLAFWLFVMTLLVLINIGVAAGAGWHAMPILGDGATWQSFITLWVDVFLKLIAVLFLVLGFSLFTRFKVVSLEWIFWQGVIAVAVSVLLATPVIGVIINASSVIPKASQFVIPTIVAGGVLAILRFGLLEYLERCGVVGDTKIALGHLSQDLPPLHAVPRAIEVTENEPKPDQSPTCIPAVALP